MEKKSINDMLTMFAWIFLTTLVTVSALSYFDFHTVNGKLQTSCQLDSNFDCTTNILLQDTNKDDTIDFELINNFNQNAIIKEIYFYEKNLEGFIDIENCKFHVNDKIDSKENKILEGFTKFYDFEKCGAFTNPNDTKIFKIKIKYTFEGSKIDIFTNGEIITNLR